MITETLHLVGAVFIAADARLVDALNHVLRKTVTKHVDQAVAPFNQLDSIPT